MNSNLPILALHGNLGLRSDWDQLGLGELLAPDLWLYASLDLEAFGRELCGPISERLERPLLLGYSLGGRLCLHAMIHQPDRWSGAVILSSHPGLSTQSECENRLENDRVWAQRAREWPWQKFLDHWNRQPVLSASPIRPGCSAICFTATQAALENRREAIATAFLNWSLGRQGDLRESLESFQAPVLWITGSEDKKFTSIALSMGEVFPNFQAVQIPGCGHRVLHEAPSLVAHLITDFRSELATLT